MARRSFNRASAGEVWHFCVAVQVCALTAAVMTTQTPSAFLINLAGFTLLLQGAAAINAGCWCLLYASARAGRIWFWGRPPTRPFGTMGLVLPTALAGFSVNVGVLAVCGRYLPGAVGSLPVAAQALGSAALLALSFYATSLHRRNKRLQRGEMEATGYLLAQRLRHHFLFNALNTTVGLIRRHPDVAMRTLENLSELFRAMLKQKPTTTLAEEIEFVRHYIHIERVRLGPRLGVEWRVSSPECLDARMPTMLIQPLVENAVYHGIEPQEKGGVIRIEIEDRGDRVFFDIRNPVGDVMPMPRAEGNRTAQKSVRERLVHAYGTACHFKSEQRRGEYRVAFSIPKEKTK